LAAMAVEPNMQPKKPKSPIVPMRPEEYIVAITQFDKIGRSGKIPHTVARQDEIVFRVDEMMTYIMHKPCPWDPLQPKEAVPTKAH